MSSCELRSRQRQSPLSFRKGSLGSGRYSGVILLIYRKARRRTESWGQSFGLCRVHSGEGIREVTSRRASWCTYSGHRSLRCGNADIVNFCIATAIEKKNNREMPNHAEKWNSRQYRNRTTGRMSRGGGKAEATPHPSPVSPERTEKNDFNPRNEKRRLVHDWKTPLDWFSKRNFEPLRTHPYGKAPSRGCRQFPNERPRRSISLSWYATVARKRGSEIVYRFPPCRGPCSASPLRRKPGARAEPRPTMLERKVIKRMYGS